MNAPAAIVPVTRVRPFYWSVRRELWENRSLYMAPRVAAAVVLIGYVLGLIMGSENQLDLSSLPPALVRGRALVPYGFSAFAIMATMVIVAYFYCLGALQGERGDRSLLFWKSLPVSDRTTVLAKAAIPMLVLPLLTFAVIVVLQAAILLLACAFLAAKGKSAAALWNALPIMSMLVGYFYALLTMALWNAPVYGWLLLVSAWAQRSTFLWATLPLLAVSCIEKIAFDSWHFAAFLQGRFTGSISRAFSVAPPDPALVAEAAKAGAHSGRAMYIPETVPDPAKFFGNPELWLGLAAAVALIAVVIRLRRLREPV